MSALNCLNGYFTYLLHNAQQYFLDTQQASLICLHTLNSEAMYFLEQLFNNEKNIQIADILLGTCPICLHVATYVCSNSRRNVVALLILYRLNFSRGPDFEDF